MDLTVEVDGRVGKDVGTLERELAIADGGIAVREGQQSVHTWCIDK